jgi:hypothetical protein
MMRINEAYMAVMAELSEQGGRWDGAHDASGAPTGGSCRGGFQDDAGATDGDMGPQSASSGDSGAFFSAWSGKARAGAPSSSTDVGPLRDPAYAYYKQGFRYFNRGATELSRKEAPDLRRALLRERTPRAYDAYVLRFALRALHYFVQLLPRRGRPLPCEPLVRGCEVEAAPNREVHRDLSAHL